MFFSNIETIGRTILIGLLAYTLLVIFLRLSGKRTLSKLNAFDFVVTIAMGSTLATILTSQKVTLAQGTTAFIMLIGLQYLFAWISLRIPLLNKLIKSRPQALVVQGIFLEEKMRKERVQEKEIMQAARSHGIASLEQVEAVVLETDGTLSIIKKTDTKDKNTLNDVSGYYQNR